MTGPKVFVSHSNLDNAFTERLVNDLKSAGADVWVDYEQIASGNFARSINEGLGLCDWVILIQTPNALSSSWVAEEVNAAVNLKHKKRIQDVIPVIAEECPPGSVPPIWDVMQAYDATKDYARALAGITRAIGLRPEQARAAPKFQEHSEPVTAPPGSTRQTPELTRVRRLVSGFVVLGVVILMLAASFFRSGPQAPPTTAASAPEMPGNSGTFADSVGGGVFIRKFSYLIQMPAKVEQRTFATGLIILTKPAGFGALLPFGKSAILSPADHWANQAFTCGSTFAPVDPQRDSVSFSFRTKNLGDIVSMATYPQSLPVSLSFQVRTKDGSLAVVQHWVTINFEETAAELSIDPRATDGLKLL